MVAEQFRKLPEKRCAIHVVSLGKHGTPALRSLSRASDGAYVEVDK